MSAVVVLILVAGWLVLSVLLAVVCALVARGGLREDGRRGYLDAELTRLVEGGPAGPVEPPRPRTTVG